MPILWSLWSSLGVAQGDKDKQTSKFHHPQNSTAHPGLTVTILLQSCCCFLLSVSVGRLLRKNPLPQYSLSCPLYKRSCRRGGGASPHCLSIWERNRAPELSSKAGGGAEGARRWEWASGTRSQPFPACCLSWEAQLASWLVWSCFGHRLQLSCHIEICSAHMKHNFFFYIWSHVLNTLLSTSSLLLSDLTEFPSAPRPPFPHSRKEIIFTGSYLAISNSWCVCIKKGFSNYLWHQCKPNIWPKYLAQI